MRRVGADEGEGDGGGAAAREVGQEGAVARVETAGDTPGGIERRVAHAEGGRDGQRDVVEAARGQPAKIFRARPDDHGAAAGARDTPQLRQAGIAARAGIGGESGTGQREVYAVVGERDVV